MGKKTLSSKKQMAGEHSPTGSHILMLQTWSAATDPTVDEHKRVTVARVATEFADVDIT